MTAWAMVKHCCGFRNRGQGADLGVGSKRPLHGGGPDALGQALFGA